MVGCTGDVTSSLQAIPSNLPQIGIGTHGSPVEVAQIQSLGMRFTRITFYTELDSPQYRRKVKDRIINFNARGIDVLITIHDFENRDSIAQYMKSLVEDIPNQTWQIGNEWDATGFTGTAYAAIMRQVVQLTPTTKYVGMGLATADGRLWKFAPGNVRVATFTQDYLNARGPILMAWSIHVYGVPLVTALTIKTRATQRVLQGAMPLWVTELGMDVEQLTSAHGSVSAEVIDSLQMHEVMTTLRNLPTTGVTRAYIYQLWTADDHGFGIFRQDNHTERPIVAALRHLQFP